MWVFTVLCETRPITETTNTSATCTKVELHLHSLICLGDTVLNYISTGTTLPFTIQDVPGGMGGHSVSHSKQKECVCVCARVCPILNVFQDRAMDVIACIKERQDALREAMGHVLAQVSKCTDVDWNFRRSITLGKLYQLV
jgi:hypothetical protein